MHGELIDRHIERHVLVERDELLGDARDLGIVDQGLAALVLLDLGGTRQQRFQIAIFADQLRRGLDADAGHAGHVVGGIADQRLHLDHLVGTDAEFLEHFGRTDALVLHRVVHGDAVIDELHQVLVGRDDRCGGAGLAGEPRIGGDQVVGLVAGLFEAGNFKGAHGVADQRELRPQVFRQIGPVRLVFGVHVGAEGFFRLVEDDRQMRRLVVLRHLGQQLPQHVAEAEHGIDLQAVGLAGQRRQRVIGAENVAGAVDQKDVVALFQGPGGGIGRRAARLWRRNWLWLLMSAWPECGPSARLNQSAGMRLWTALFRRLQDRPRRRPWPCPGPA